MTSQELYKAIVDGDLTSIGELISSGVDINQSLGLRGTPLCAAIDTNQMSVVEFLIEANCDVNEADVDCEPPLSLAIRKKHEDIALLLIEKGADVNKKDSVSKNPPLCSAVENELYKVTESLLNSGVNNQCQGSSDNTALHIATHKGNLKLMNLLIEHGCLTSTPNVAGNRPLHVAACQGDLGAIWLLVGSQSAFLDEPMCSAEVRLCLEAGRKNSLLVKRESLDKCEAEHIADSASLKRRVELCDINQGTVFSNDSPLHLAVLSERLLTIKLLIHAGADVNRQNNQGHTPLFLACSNNKLDIAKVLLKAGANPNLQGTKKKFRHNYVVSDNQVIPLALAAENKNVELAQLLIDHGSLFSVGQVETAMSNPLFCALFRNATDVAHCILKNVDRFGESFNINAQDTGGGSYLFAVANCECEQIPLAKKLIELGCDVNIQTHDYGETTLQHAIDLECPSLLRLLLKHGADHSMVNCMQENALHTSIIADSIECVEILLEYGADLDVLYSPYEAFTPISPLMVAIDHNHFEIAELLLEAGAETNKKHYVFNSFTEDTLDTLLQEREDFAVKVVDMMKNPPSLLCCAVRRIRAEFRQKLIPFQSVSLLSLPEGLKDKIWGKSSCLTR